MASVGHLHRHCLHTPEPARHNTSSALHPAGEDRGSDDTGVGRTWIQVLHCVWSQTCPRMVLPTWCSAPATRGADGGPTSSDHSSV